jgi:membrane protein DedA with SNARE-associated domain
MPKTKKLPEKFQTIYEQIQISLYSGVIAVGILFFLLYVWLNSIFPAQHVLFLAGILAGFSMMKLGNLMIRTWKKTHEKRR